MSHVYWINTFRSVPAEARLRSYAELAGPVMSEFGGQFLARGLPFRAFERGVIARTVLIEFPDRDSAIAAYESDDYRRAREALGAEVERDIRIVPALPRAPERPGPTP